MSARRIGEPRGKDGKGDGPPVEGQRPPEIMHSSSSKIIHSSDQNPNYEVAIEKSKSETHH